MRMGVLYRLSQFWQNVTARPLTQPEIEEVSADLTPGELALFRQMSVSDQQHALRVCRLLRNCGMMDSDLLAAALLHDVGKVRVKLTAWDRTLAVLGEKIAPVRVAEWGQGEGTGWKRTFVVRKQHAAWGAALAAEAGSSPSVVDLILQHQDLSPVNGRLRDERLVLLQWADNQS